MKKILCSVLSIISAAMLSSCGRGGNMPLETNTPMATAPATQATATTVPTTNNTTNQENLIGEEKAKEIALQKAGLSHGEVIFDRVELERDNGVLHYEIEFKKGTTEYDADINAADGTIMTWDMDTDD